MTAGHYLPIFDPLGPLRRQAKKPSHGHHGAAAPWRHRCRHGAAAPLVGSPTASEHVRLRLRHACLHDHHPHGLQSCADERSGAVHAGGPGAHRRAGRGAVGVHEPLHAGLHPRRRLGRGLLGAPGHHRARQRLPHGGRARHVAGQQLRVAPHRTLRHQRWRRVRGGRGARLRGRDRAGFLARPPVLPRRLLHHGRHPPQLRLQLRARRPAAAPRLARHVRAGCAPAAAPRSGRARDAGVAAVARHARA